MRHPASTYRTKEERRKEALERQTERDKRSPQDQLNLLDQLFGKGQGAKRERKRLASLLEDNTNSIREKKTKRKKKA